jgi:hypothetical protein
MMTLREGEEMLSTKAVCLSVQPRTGHSHDGDLAELNYAESGPELLSIAQRLIQTKQVHPTPHREASALRPLHATIRMQT